MRVTEQGRLVYLNPPRTGSKTIDLQLRRNFKDLTKTKGISGHQTVWEPKWDSYFIFASVRSPFTRAVSLWRRSCEALWNRDKKLKATLQQGKISFEDALFHPELAEWWESTPCVRFTEGVPRLDLIVRQEQLRKYMSQVSGVRWHVMVRQHVSKMKIPWHKHYNERCVKRIHELYEEDFETFKYQLDFDKAKRGKLRV